MPIDREALRRALEIEAVRHEFEKLQAEAAVMRDALEAYVKMVSAYGVDHPAIRAIQSTTAGADLLEELRLLRAVAEAADAYERESMDAPYYDTTENDLKNFRAFRRVVAEYRTRQSGAYQEGEG